MTAQVKINFPKLPDKNAFSIYIYLEKVYGLGPGLKKEAAPRLKR